jgi:anti-sigma factor RsiW
MRNHVHDLLTAYVHRQLPRKEHNRVLLHLQMCAECRDAMEQELELVRDLKTYMPTIGRPKPGQLARLWPLIWAEFRATQFKRPSFRMPSYSMALVIVLIVCVFITSSLFSMPTFASAAPDQPGPQDVKATATKIYTSEPTSVSYVPSETADAPVPPMASPAPMVVVDTEVSTDK